MINKSLNYAYPQKFAEGGDVAPAENQSYSFVIDGDSYNMGGNSLEQAIANVQENYNLPPGSFTVNNNTTRTLMGTYDSATGNFKSASEPASEDIFGATTMAVGEEDGGQTVPPDEGMVTTMAMGEEDAPFLEPDMDEIIEIFRGRAEKVKRDFGDEPMFPETPATPTAPLLRSNPFFDMPLESPFANNPNAFTRAIGEDGGSGNLFQGPQPVVPGAGLTFSPRPLTAPVQEQPIEGRTYGMYSNTPAFQTNSIQPFTPYMPPQQAQSSGVESLITDTDFYANNSAPRTSVFKRN
tara:strand:- start:108 stop:992 length:885 start_codon:yes stop_codon:yes gene_type:complete